MSLALNMVIYNEQARLHQVLKTYRALFDEIVIIDHGSDDDTGVISRSFSDAYVWFPHKPPFFCEPYRNVAKDLTKSDWILVLDADETLTSSFILALPQLLENQNLDAYQLLRENRVDKELINQEHHLRLARRTSLKHSTNIHTQPFCVGRFDVLPFVCLEHFKTQAERDVDEARYQKLKIV